MPGSPPAAGALYSEILDTEVLDTEVLDAANAALLTPRLRTVLDEIGAAGTVAGDLTAFVDRFYALNRTRNALLAGQLAEAARAINRVGIRPLVLKGAITLLTEDADLRARRVVTDLDLQVPEACAEPVERALSEIGYTRLRGYSENPHAHAVADLERPGDGAALDLHRYLLSYAGHRTGRAHVADLLPPEAVRARAELRCFRGGELLVPCPRDQVMHLILQDQVQDRDHFAGRIKLRRLLDLAEILSASPELDTDAIVAELRPYGLAPAARSHLYAAHALFAAPVGEGIRSSLTARLHHRRRMVQLAYPGLAFANALLGAVAYEFARCRFPPGARTGTLLRWRAARLSSLVNRRRLGLLAQLRHVAGRL
jgi:hypothetical protein